MNVLTGDSVVLSAQKQASQRASFHLAIASGRYFFTGMMLLFCVLALCSSAGAQTLTSTSFSYGNEALGDPSAAKTATFKNTQTGPLTINSVAISGTNTGDFELGGNCPLSPSTLTAGASCMISVTFTPSALGSRSATVTITNTASGPQTIGLNGTGIAAVTLSASSLSFGTVVIGNNSLAKTVTLTSSMNVKLTFASILSSPGFAIASNTCGASIAVKGKCTVGVTFSPTALSPATGVLTFTDSASSSPQTVALSGTGSAAVTFTPPTLTFSGRIVGTTSSPLSVTITNHLTSGLSVSSAVTTGDFAVASNTCGSDVGGKCIIGVTFTPTEVGSRSGTLTVGYSAFGSPITVNLIGTGTATGLGSITVTPANTSIVAGGSQQFIATGNFTNGNKENLTDSVTWSTNGGKINSTGLETTSAAGVYNIKATLNSIVGQTMLNVTPATLVSIALSPVSPSVAVGNTQQFTALGTYSDGSTGSLPTSVFSSSNTSAATITSAGLATGVMIGSTNITATLSGVTSPADSLIVVGPILKSIIVSATQGSTNPAAPSLANGTSVQLFATGIYNNNGTQDLTSQVNWSSNSANATVSNSSGSQGLVNAASVGTATISATLGQVNGGALVTVTAPVLKSIAITPATLSAWSAGTTQQFTATGTFTDGTTQNVTTSATWSSNNAAVATIISTGTQAGLATSLAQGTVTISAALSGINASTQILTVGPATLVSVTVYPENPYVALGTTQTFRATGNYTDGSTADLTNSVTWSATPNSSGAATFAANVATATAQGVVTITATTSSSIAGSTQLTITAATLTSIAVTPATASIHQGGTQQFMATGTFSDGTTQDLTSSVTWGTNNGAVAMIATSGPNTGLATSVGGGTASITATLNSIVSTNTGGDGTLTVVAITSIAVTPANPTLPVGNAQFTATATYADSTTSDVTASVTWSSSNTAVATISSTGQASVLGAGTSTITATFGSVSGNTLLTGTVPTATLQSITVTPNGVSLPNGGTQQFTAIGSYSDGSTQDITSTVTWTSGNPSIVTIGSAGVSGTTPGLATVIADPNPAVAISVTASSGSVPPDGSTNTAWVSTIYTTVGLQSITVSPNGVSLNYGGMQQFKAVGTYSDGSTQDLTSTATWSSANPAIVTIGSAGVPGTIPGLATVVANPDPAVAIAVTASSGSIPPDGSTNTGFVSTIYNPNLCVTTTVDMQLLVVNNSANNYADFPAIQQVLNYVGTPYTVVDAASGTLPTLSDGACHGYFQGVIYAFGDDIYTFPYPVALSLAQYESKFGVRQLNWNTNPTPDFGLNYYTGYVPSNGTDTGTFTSVAGPIFFYANTSTPVTITNAFIYLTTPTTPTGGGTVTPLLVDPQGNTLSAVTNFSDGRQYLSQMFDSNQYLTHDLVLAYGLLNWVTKGVFLGDYHVYASAQVDDFFIDDSEWIPGTPCTNPITHDRTPPDSPLLGVFRIDATNDMAAVVAWQSNVQKDPLLSNFELTLAFNGVGTTGNNDWTGLPNPGVGSDDLVTNVQNYQGNFHWISHTFDHPNTLNGLTQSSPNGDGDDIDLEVLTNLFVANGTGVNLDTDSSDTVTTLGLTDFNPANMVTPGVTGLNDPNVPTYLYNDGIRNVVTDTSVIGQPNNGPNPTPNVGIVNNTQPGLYEVPRHPNDIFYNAANWADDQAEFSCIYNNPVDPPFNNYSAAQILDFVSSSFVSNMLIGDMDPEMFHQPDLHFSDNSANLGVQAPHVSSLLSDTYDQTFQKYEALYNLPVLSPTLDKTALLMQNRNSFNLSGVTASITGIGSANPQIVINMPNAAPVTSAVIPVTGVSSNGSEIYGGQNISHLTMTPGTTVTLPLQ